MTERLVTKAECRIRHIRLIEHAPQAQTGTGQQGLVFAIGMFTGHFVEQLGFQQAAVQQPGIETGERARVSMAVGSRLLHAAPFRLVGTGKNRRRIGKSSRGHRCWLSHHAREQALRSGVPHVPLLAGDMRHTFEFAIGQANMKVQPERLGDARDDGFSRPAPIDPAQHLANQPAIGDRRITVAFARCPPGLFGGQRLGHLCPVVQRFGGQLLTQGWQARSVTQQLADRYALLAGGGELRPITRDGGIQLKLAFGDQLQRGHSSEGLGAGKQIENGVAVPGLLAILVGNTCPQVDHGFTTNLHAQCSAPFLRIVE